MWGAPCKQEWCGWEKSDGEKLNGLVKEKNRRNLLKAKKRRKGKRGRLPLNGLKGQEQRKTETYRRSGDISSLKKDRVKKGGDGKGQRG